MIFEFLLSSGEKELCLIKENTRAKRIILKRTKANELILTLPNKRTYSTKKIEEILKKQEDWILKTRKEALVPPQFLELHALNEKWAIEYKSSGFEKVQTRIDEEKQKLLILGVADIKDISQALNKFILKKAKAFLPQRLEHCYQAYHFTQDTSEVLKYSSAKGRWGSYSSRKELTLNARIICLPLDLVDYVIVHELCHRNNFNHGKTFYEQLATRMPNHKEREKRIKNNLLPPILWL